MRPEKTLPVFVCNGCMSLFEDPDYDGYDTYCPECGDPHFEVREERDAQWWTVAVYHADRAYGGPEEGGWYYDTGVLEPMETQVFKRLGAAERYYHEMWERFPSPHYRVETYVERFPPRHIPEVRPRYC